MKNIFRLSCLSAIIMLLSVSCEPGDNGGGSGGSGDGGSTEVAFAKGADLGWITEMEAKGYKFYNASGVEKECTALMKEIGFNSVRYRVWVNPSSGYNNMNDVLQKCKRAQALGMQIMIDFHYSDTWADPGKQIIPAAWQSMDAGGIAAAVNSHTRSVLQTLKNNKIDVAWVQVGNEVRPGMLVHTGTESSHKEAPESISGKVSGNSVGHFVEYFNSGASAVKAVYPDARVILHLDNGWDSGMLTWFLDLMKKNEAKYDMIGLSLYPSYWDTSIGGYPDWSTKTKQCVENLTTLHSRYNKPVMIVEFGMPASEPAKAKAALQYVLQSTTSNDWFKGIFYWEPESEKARNGYDYGAFADGKPTIALSPFSD